MSNSPRQTVPSLQPAYLEPYGGRKPEDDAYADCPAAWEPSPIPQSASLDEYRFGTVAPSLDQIEPFDELASDTTGSRESSGEGSVDATWPSVLSTSPPSAIQLTTTFVEVSSPSAPSNSSTSPVAPSAGPPVGATRRKGLLRMPRSAQTGPVPPSLLARRGSLSRIGDILSSSFAAYRGGSLGLSPLLRSSSLDVVGRSLTSDQPMSDPEVGPIEANTTLLSHRTAATGGGLQPPTSVPARLGSPIGRPVIQRPDSLSSSRASTPGSAHSSVLSTSAPSSYFPPVQAPAKGLPSPMTPDSPTVVLSQPSPLKSIGSRTSELAAPSIYSQARAGAFPFPSQNGTATPPMSPALTRPLLKLPSKVINRSPSPPATTHHGGQLSPHMLDDHVLNPLFNARYELRSSLGSGGYGFVCIALDRVDLREVAVKFILKAKVPAHSWVEYGDHGVEGDGMPPRGGLVPMECELLLRIKHWGIVKGLACYADHKFFYLIQELHGSSWGPSTPGTPLSGNTPSVSAYMPALVEGMPLPSPYAPSFALPPSPSCASPPMLPTTPQRPSMTFERRGSCDLFECVEAHKRFSEGRSRMIFAQIIETVHYLASHCIYHRDIKDENIVVDREYRVKLIDFGSAVWERDDEPTVYREFYGTTAYASAEILSGGSYRASQAEVWSLGILLNILITGESPFSSPANAQASRRSPLRAGVTMSAEAADLIARCLDVNPATRLTIDGIRGHRWLGLSVRH